MMHGQKNIKLRECSQMWWRPERSRCATFWRLV